MAGWLCKWLLGAPCHYLFPQGLLEYFVGESVDHGFQIDVSSVCPKAAIKGKTGLFPPQEGAAALLEVSGQSPSLAPALVTVCVWSGLNPSWRVEAKLTRRGRSAPL